ncbi:hypothetical protein C8J57DRAFT_1375467, partial [Mycena rebaudengoi]
FGRTAMSRRLIFRYILIFPVSIPLSPDSGSFLLWHSKALPRHHLCVSQHSWPVMVIPTPYFDSTAPQRVILLSTLDIGPRDTEIPGNSSPRQIGEA